MIVFDTETTGLLRPSATEVQLQPFMIEICAIKVNKDFEIIDEFNSLVNPPIPISDEIIKITNITNEMLKDQPAFPLIYEDLASFFLGERTLVGHNCSFDVDILRYELARMECEVRFPWPYEHICTVEKSFAIQNRRMRLSHLYELATGKTEIKDNHRARGDVIALIDCVRFLSENNFL